MFRLKRLFLPAWGFFLLFASPLYASPKEASVQKGDTAWLLISSALVFLMTPGLALFYGGLVRRKNILSVLNQCLLCICLVSVLWILVGYSFAFGSSTLGGLIGGLDFVFSRNLFGEERGGIPHQLFMMFQGMFAVITPALIIGAFAERIKFSSFCVFTALWLIFVYCPIAHWVWGGAEGFFALGEAGALDFAGGTVVHINAGIAGLMASLVLGKRQGWPEKTSPPHNLPLSVLGAGLLWFGWFGFNAGSALSANSQAVNAFVVSHVSAASAGLSWCLIEWFRNGKATALGLITGLVAGLVGITPAAGYVDPLGALAIGAGASIASYLAVTLLKPSLGFDDALDVFGVHGIAGIWGAIATGLFASSHVPGNTTDGFLFGNPNQLLLQLKAVAYTIVWSGAISFVLFEVVDLTLGLRVKPHDERVGLDLTDHAETAYTLID